MTTIAYKDGVIAYDSRETKGSIIHTDEANKKRELDGVYFFLCGDNCGYKDVMSEWFCSTTKTLLNVCGIAVDEEGTLWEFGNDDGFWRDRINLSEPYVYGSGSSFALTAMDLGLSAKDAVKMAIKRDVYSGGKVNTFKCNAKG